MIKSARFSPTPPSYGMTMQLLTPDYFKNDTLQTSSVLPEYSLQDFILSCESAAQLSTLEGKLLIHAETPSLPNYNSFSSSNITLAVTPSVVSQTIPMPPPTASPAHSTNPSPPINFDLPSSPPSSSPISSNAPTTPPNKTIPTLTHWAGGSFTNSPAPSCLPIPSFNSSNTIKKRSISPTPQTSPTTQARYLSPPISPTQTSLNEKTKRQLLSRTEVGSSARRQLDFGTQTPLPNRLSPSACSMTSNDATSFRFNAIVQFPIQTTTISDIKLYESREFGVQTFPIQTREPTDLEHMSNALREMLKIAATP